MSSGLETVEMTLRQWQDIVEHFFVADHKLKVIPAKRNHKLAVFEWLARQFELDRKYTEREINLKLEEAHPDYATLRRGLFDEYFFNRKDGISWRTPAEQKLVISRPVDS